MKEGGWTTTSYFDVDVSEGGIGSCDGEVSEGVVLNRPHSLPCGGGGSRG